jgi:hypothetical protein
VALEFFFCRRSAFLLGLESISNECTSCSARSRADSDSTAGITALVANDRAEACSDCATDARAYSSSLSWSGAT